MYVWKHRINEAGRDGVCLIEWSTLIQEIIPDNAIEIVIEKDLEKGFDYRKITIGQEAV